VVAQFADGRAAAVESVYGAGKTLMLGSYVGAAYESRRGASAERFYAALLNWAGVERPYRVEGAPVEIRELVSGTERLLFVINHARAAVETKLAVRAAKRPAVVVDLVSGAKLECRFAGGHVHLAVAIAGEDTRVIRLTNGTPGE
jgi:hypothetical protein